jgi:hypothetical protein
MRIFVIGIALLGLMTACGGTTEQRAATGGASGPVGAVVGGAAGAAGGSVLDEGVDQKAKEAIR